MFDRLQRAVFTQLRTDPGLCPVYDYVPEGAKRPYVTFTSPWSADNYGLTYKAERVWFQMSTWSDYRGFLEAAQIDGRLERLLGGVTLPLEGGGYCQILADNAHAMRDVNPGIRQVARTFYIPFFYLGRAPAVVERSA